MKKLELSFYFLCLFVTASFVYHRGQDVNYDLLNYHFYQGYFLTNGRFMQDMAAAGGLHSFFNPTADALVYLSLTHLPFPLSAWVFLLIQLTSIPALVLLGKEIANGLGYPRVFIPAIPAIILSLLAPVWWSELGTSLIESWTAPLIIYGVYVLFTAHRGAALSMTRIAIAGVLFGLAVGLKMTNGLFAVSGFLMLVPLLYRSGLRVSVLAVFYFLAGCGVGFLPTAWWNWYLWVVWDSPVFPYYNAVFKSEFWDFTNWNNYKWHFSSFQEFLTFMVQAAWGTTRTAQITFADARFLFVTMLVPAAILCKPAMRLNRQLMAFMLFMASSLLLWVLMFSIHRYLVPFELLLGLLIWILVVRIVERDWLRKSLMIGLCVCAGSLIKVPDWGHKPIALGGKNPFSSVEMDEQIYATPARYVVIGDKMTYVLPLFHSDSKFYGLYLLSRQARDRIFRKLAEPSELPLRILAKDGDAAKIPDILKLAGYGSLDQPLLDCKHFRTRLDRYTVCELSSEESILEKMEPVSPGEKLDFASSAKGVHYLQAGWSEPEDWGTWSDSRSAAIFLPASPAQVDSVVMDFAATVSPSHPVQRVEILVNGSSAFSGSITERFDTLEFKIPDAAKSDAFKGITMEFRLPDAARPKDIGLGEDTRTLALALRTITLTEDFLEKMEPVSPGEKLDFGSSGKGVHYLQAGWSDPEDWGTWSASRSATILLPASPAQVDSVVMDFSAAVSTSHPAQRIEIFVNGSQAYSGSISERSDTLEFKIPDAAKSDAFKGIKMEFRLPDAARPKDIGLGEDTRTLALALRTITLTER